MKRSDLFICGQQLDPKLIKLDELGRLERRGPAIMRRYITYDLLEQISNLEAQLQCIRRDG